MSEGRSCDAVIRVLEQKFKKQRSNVIYPERDKAVPPVECRLSLGQNRFAIEHTLVEAFKGQIEAEARFSELVENVRQAISTTLPRPGTYYLKFPLDSTLGHRDLNEARTHLLNWIRFNAQQLFDEHPSQGTRNSLPSGYTGVRKGRPQGFPYDVVLERNVHWTSAARHQGVLIPMRYVTEEFDLEAHRKVRLKLAIDRKRKKLNDCRPDTTILVLEDRDIALSNFVVIREALRPILREDNESPDMIFLAECIGTTATVRLLAKNGTISRIYDRGHTFSYETLNDITNSERQRSR
jgi:hypothetical protein